MGNVGSKTEQGLKVEVSFAFILFLMFLSRDSQLLESAAQNHWCNPLRWRMHIRYNALNHTLHITTTTRHSPA